MSIVQYLAIAAVCYCVVAMFVHFLRIVRLGVPKDKSEPSGSVAEGVVYSNTTAMLPNHKESAYLHLPSYAVGILFHIGIFTSLMLFLLLFFTPIREWLADGCWRYAIAALPAVGTVCGIILFVKRLISNKLKTFSTPDDFISVVLVALFQCFTTLYTLFPTSNLLHILYYISCILLFLYMPLGKLRHAVYFFAARFHLGFFYGRRNVWPEKKNDSK